MVAAKHRQVDQETAREDSELIQSKLEKPLGAKGFTITNRSSRYRSHQITFTITMTRETADGLTQEGLDFNRYLSVHGLKAETLGASFVHKGDSYTVTGYLAKNPKFCIQATNNSNGKGYKWPVKAIKRLVEGA